MNKNKKKRISYRSRVSYYVKNDKTVFYEHNTVEEEGNEKRDNQEGDGNNDVSVAVCM